MLANLFEPLNLEQRLESGAVREKITEMGGRGRKVIPLKPCKHIFTHVEWWMEGFLVYTDPFDAERGIWAGEDDILTAYPIPSAFRSFTKDLGRYFEGVPD